MLSCTTYKHSSSDIRRLHFKQFQVSDLHNDGTIVSNIEVVGSEETLGHIVYKISREVTVSLFSLYLCIFAVYIIINSIVVIADAVEML